MTDISIYALLEDERVRYIGCSARPYARLDSHLAVARSGRHNSAKDIWLRSLLARGQQPLLRVLATVPPHSAASAEQQYIDEYRASGCALTNGRSPAYRTQRPPHRVSPVIAGARLRAARHRRFLTMAQLAEQVGVDWRVVQRWETDKARPHPSNLEKLCAALDVSYDDLVVD